MSVASKIGSEETVSRKYIVPIVDLSSDEEEGLYGKAKSCARKATLPDCDQNSLVPVQNVKRMKLSDDIQTPLKGAEMIKASKIEMSEQCIKGMDRKMGLLSNGPSDVLIINISDDSST
ncbi:hypothetical protein F511_32457 [Dorcoceras hygrometricum]|uniref:Uncharacterized protein n=1 Tax=Dorcoceras hygrometricum TaxID=472368 RepID=A0A2Z7DDX4_9LAMI|nr:hypothetical protein F511_32457 [Dorcoceras hygrometricum]